MKRIITLILAITMLLCMPIQAWAEEKDLQQEMMPGYLPVFALAPGETKIPVLVKDEVIYAPYDVIGNMADMTATCSEPTIWFTRENYTVMADIDGKEAYIYTGEEPSYVSLYGGASFPLEDVIAFRDTYYLPLEQLLYLTNTQFIAPEDKVFMLSSGETLWDLVGEYADMFINRPTKVDLLGDTLGEYLGNSSRYVLLSIGDELDYRLFLPFVGDEVIDSGKVKDALLELSSDDDLSRDLGDSFNAKGQELSGYIRSASTMAGSIETAEKALKSPLMGLTVSKKKLEAQPEWLGKVADGADLAARVVETGLAAFRSYTWAEDYMAQLELLAQADISTYGNNSRIKAMQKQALLLAAESKFKTGTTIKAAMEQTADFLAGKVFEFTPIGRAVAVYNVCSTAAAAFPDVKNAFETGDDAYTASCLIDIYSVATDIYADSVNASTAEPTEEKLEKARQAGVLLNRTALRIRDKLLDIRDADGTPEGDLAELMAFDYDLLVRYSECAQYDPRLIIDSRYSNLYSSEPGAQRQQIPLELVEPEGAVVELEYATGNTYEVDVDMDGKLDTVSFTQTDTLATHMVVKTTASGMVDYTFQYGPIGQGTLLVVPMEGARVMVLSEYSGGSGGLGGRWTAVFAKTDETFELIIEDIPSGKFEGEFLSGTSYVVRGLDVPFEKTAEVGADFYDPGDKTVDVDSRVGIVGYRLNEETHTYDLVLHQYIYCSIMLNGLGTAQTVLAYQDGALVPIEQGFTVFGENTEETE